MLQLDRRDGFTLPMALLVLLVLTGTVLTTLNQSSTERRLVDSERAGRQALQLAETGLEQYGSLGLDFANSTQDSVRVALQGGYADVMMNRVRAGTATTPAVYAVRSRGVSTEGAWAGAPDGVRMVARLGVWVEGTMDVHAGWTSLGGLTKNGAAGTLSGEDDCGQVAAVAGVAVPSSPGYSGHTAPVIGSPPIKDLGPTREDAADAVNIDWDGIVNGGLIDFDYIIDDDPWPTDFTDWPVVYVDNEGETFSLPTTGRGTLIVRGNLTVSGNLTWRGVVLVGGQMTSNGDNTVMGATVSGLNIKLDETVPVSDVGNGTKQYQYDSCNVRDAMQAQAHLQIQENTWIDNWAQY